MKSPRREDAPPTIWTPTGRPAIAWASYTPFLPYTIPSTSMLPEIPSERNVSERASLAGSTKVTGTTPTADSTTLYRNVPGAPQSQQLAQVAIQPVRTDRERGEVLCLPNLERGRRLRRAHDHVELHVAPDRLAEGADVVGPLLLPRLHLRDGLVAGGAEEAAHLVVADDLVEQEPDEHAHDPGELRAERREEERRLLRIASEAAEESFVFTSESISAGRSSSGMDAQPPAEVSATKSSPPSTGDGGANSTHSCPRFRSAATVSRTARRQAGLARQNPSVSRTYR